MIEQEKVKLSFPFHLIIREKKYSISSNRFFLYTSHSFSFDVGYICERRHLEKTSECCDTTSVSIQGPFICDNCTKTNQCCSSFEHCISCCLKPEHVRKETIVRFEILILLFFSFNRNIFYKIIFVQVI